MNIHRIESIIDGPVRFPQSREDYMAEEDRKDQEAYDQLCQQLEHIFSLPARHQDRWRRTYRKMTEHLQDLEQNGSVHEKSPDSGVYALKYRRTRNGERVQSSIHIGPLEVANMVTVVLNIWRTGDELADLTGEAIEPEPSDPLRQCA